MPLISVVIPTYNRAHLITSTIDTVLQQTFKDYEVIIVDDGSKDNTGAVIREKYSNPRVRYFFKENGERGAARNYGIKQAKGDYVLFFDSDDLMKPGYLQILSNMISANPGIFMLAAKYNFKDQEGKEKNSPIAYVPGGWYSQDFFLKGNILACNYCIRIKEPGFEYFPEPREMASMEDWLFLLVNLNGKKLLLSDEVGLSMLEHDERSMANNQKVIDARRKATKWVTEKLKLDPSREKTLRAWSHYFCGIHEYLDHKRGASVNEAMKAIRLGGINKKFLTLLAKSIVGRKITSKLK